MIRRRRVIARPLILLSGIVFLLACATWMRPLAKDWDPPSAPAQAGVSSPRDACADRVPLRQAFFGDLHVHTHYSFDARSRDMLGTPDDAYRFARGEEIGLGPFDELGKGTRSARLERPLDFAAVTDHAEWIGEVTLCTELESDVYDTDSCRAYRGEIEVSRSIPFLPKSRMMALMGMRSRKEEVCGPDGARCRAGLRNAWQTTQAATERWNDTTSSCSFTAFHGWEHSNSVAMSKVHRNVIFRNATVPELPISSLERPTAIELWDELEKMCGGTQSGCEALTIPHNPNVSNGRLFEVTYRGESMQEQLRQATMRARMEPLVEMMQIKGESECRNGLYGVVGGEDELCTFEKVRGAGPLEVADCKEGTGSGALGGRGCESRLDYARYALIEGLRERERIGVNPYAFGFVGSTDTHNATPGDVEEYDYLGCCASVDAEVEQRLSPEPSFAGKPQAMRNPGGLMGVWAEENSRDALFDAMKRRETFATSGPRIAPRFFAGWDLPGDLCTRRDWLETADREGVAMGGILEAPLRSGVAPVFLARVGRDPGTEAHPGGLLTRLQIVKAWYGEDGDFHQAVHDVAGTRADPPTPIGGNTSPSIEASVDMATCEPRGAGYDELCAVWRDPDYDPTRAAVYYVRAVENPSCRWSWRACLSLPEADRPSTCDDPTIPRTIQERAWTSPVWVNPS